MKLQSKLLIGVFLVIGIFVVFQNFSYSQTSEQEKGEKKVELLSHKIQSIENSSKFIGQVHNTINKSVEYVIIIGTFYNENGEIGSKSTYTKPNTLKPNMTGSFEMILGNDLPSNITSYDVTITWRFPGESERYFNAYG